MATKFLDKTGLAHFWSKIKSWVTSRGYITSSGSITGNAATATRLGISTVGSSVQPIYLESGTATAVNSALRTCYGGVESEAVSNTYFKIGSGSITEPYNHLKVKILVQHLTSGNSCIWDIWLSTGRTAGSYSQGHSRLFNSTGYYGANLIVAYKSNSGGSLDFELYVKETARYSNHRFTVIQECWRNNQKVGDILTLYNQLTSTGTSNITSEYTALTTTVGTVNMNINGSSTSCSGNAATASAVAWSGVTDKPSTFTPASHNQASNTITAMTSYAKANVSSAIATSDSLNTAIGKLEYKIDTLNANSVPPLKVVSLTANTSLTVTDSYTYQKVICLNTSGITVTLPTCSNSNARFFIKNNTNSKCYLALASGVTLDGSSDTIDLDPYGYINVIYGGSTNKYIIIGGSI